MSVVKMITADVGDTSQFSAVNTSLSTVAVSTEQARTGTKSFKHSGNATSTDVYVTGRADYYVRVGLYITGLDTTATQYIEFRETNLHVRIRCNSDGTLSALRDTTVLGTTAASCLTTNTWYCLEAYVKIHDSTGIVTVKVNGVQVLALTGQDTRNGDTVGQISNIRIGRVIFAGTLYADDIMIRDDTWCGQGGIYLLSPTGAGTEAHWTASAGDPYACVDELPPSFTDYIYTDVATAGTLHTFAHGALPITPSSISAVCVLAKAQLDAAGSGAIRSVLLSDATYGNGASTALDTSGVWAENYLALDPDGGGAWSLAAVNAAEIGVESLG